MTVDVTWHGQSCFRLRGKGAVVVTDPYPPALGPKLKLEANLVTVSHEHENHGHVQSVREATYVIDGPGEYEVAGVTVQGLPTFHDNEKGARHGRNTVYVIELDDVRVCHLGDLGHTLSDDALETLGNIDVLLVPVGGGAALDGAAAAEVVRQVEPRYVVPMHYGHPSLRGDLQPVDRFLKEMGVAEAEPQAKLAVQSSSVEGETKVVVLEPRT
jgi:L-ascorbate metabolism protein UlaG (beta-lactamase superfamily)